jgi:1,4-dihydroxy-6-naphthoate synthase
VRVRIAHSPDSDDAFMFCALSTGKVRIPFIEVEHVLKDIETLNRAAAEGVYEVSAVSIHGYAHLHRRYRLMPCGASMGEGYGPVVVARRGLQRLEGRRVALPGEWTSAAAAARLHTPELVPVYLPFDQVMDAVRKGEVDAGVIIHEGQLTFEDEGLVEVVNLGRWWAAREDGLPLPLGGNVVRRDLDPELQVALTRATRDSIVWALEHRDEALSFAMKHARGLDRGKADRFVGMYVNERTVDYGPDGIEAMRRFLHLLHASGIIDTPAPLDLVELEPAGERAA